MVRTGRKQWFVNSSRAHLRRANRRFAKHTADGMLVLDAGAGSGPYRSLFSHARYEAADFKLHDTDYTELDYVCDLVDIPVEDCRFDRVIFNQVLEHVDDPRRVITELFRVLKPGGRLLCTCPLFYEEHQTPYDYYRYTSFGLRRLFEDAGFEVVRLQWMEGYFGTVSYQFAQMDRHLPRQVRSLDPGWRIVYLAPMVWATRRLARLLMGGFSRADLRWKYTDSGMPKNYLLIARKP